MADRDFYTKKRMTLQTQNGNQQTRKKSENLEIHLQPLVVIPELCC